MVAHGQSRTSVVARRRSHLAALTGLRFVAALQVVFFHEAVSLLRPGPLRRLGDAGYIGVSLFFVLSGFVMAYTYLEPFDAPRINRREFFRARFARIYPAYVLALVAALPVYLPWAVSNLLKPGVLGPAKAAVTTLANVTLLQGWFPLTVPPWNTPGWSLSVEALFYALFPFLGVWLTRRKSRSLASLAGGLWLATIGVAVVFTAAHPSLWTHGGPESPLRSLMFLKYFPLMHVSEFVIGIACGLLYLRYGDRASALRRRSAVVSIGVTLLVMAALSSPYQLPYPLLHSGLLAPLFGILIVSLASDSGPLAAVLRTRPMVFLGEASYALYLLHEPLSDILYKRRWSPLGDIAAGPRFLIYLAIVIAASCAVLVWYEQPARRWLRGAGLARPQRPPDQEGVPRPVTAEPQI